MKNEKYRPTSGTEGIDFISEWCDNCSNQGVDGDDLDCEILSKVYIYEIEDDEYPDEWCFDEQGVPCCTNYNIARNEHTAKARYLREKHGQLRLPNI